MTNPDPEQQIQTPGTLGTPSAPVERVADSTLGDAVEPVQHRQRTVFAGTVYGAFVGAVMGAIVGGACCWITGQIEDVWHGILIGAIIGPFAGAFIGAKERQIRGDLVRPDVATLVCTIFSLVPALLVLLQAMGAVRGSFSAYLLVGTVFVAPFIGLLIGALFDRALEASGRRSWPAALVFAAAGLAACTGLLLGIDALCYGPDPRQVGREMRSVLITEWRKDPDLQDAKIHSLSVRRTGRTTYAGFVDATVGGLRERLTLDVRIDGEMIFWKLAPKV